MTRAGSDIRESLRMVDPATLRQWLDGGQATLLDVREPAEHAGERIVPSALLPLSAFDPARAPVDDGRPLVVHCKSGIRTQKAGEMLLQAGRGNVYSLQGGIEAWKRAGLPTVVNRDAGTHIDVQRQTFIVVSLMILAGLALGVWVSPWGLILALIAGLGLLNAGLTGLCPLASLIARMPWNQRGAQTQCCAKPPCEP